MYWHRTGSDFEQDDIWRHLQFSLPIFGAETAFMAAPGTPLEFNQFNVVSVKQLVPLSSSVATQVIWLTALLVLFLGCLLQSSERKEQWMSILYRCIEVIFATIAAGKQLRNKWDHTWFTSAMFISVVPFFLVVTMLMQSLYFVFIQRSPRLLEARPTFVDFRDLILAAQRGESIAISTEYSDLLFMQNNNLTGILTHYPSFSPSKMRNQLISTPGSVLYGNMLHFTAMVNSSHESSPSHSQHNHVCPLHVTTSTAKHLFGLIFRSNSPWVEMFNRAILAHQDEIDRIVGKYTQTQIRCHTRSVTETAPPPLTAMAFLLLLYQAQVVQFFLVVTLIGCIDCCVGIRRRAVVQLSLTRSMSRTTITMI